MASAAIRPAVFLDRDGVVVEEVGHINRIEQLRLIPGSAEAIRQFNGARVPVVVVTNQSVVARGGCTEAEVQAIHDVLHALVQEQDSRIDGIYYCPHHPAGEVEAYRVACACRKPNPGLFQKAAQEFGIDITRSIIIGDKLSDLEAGWAIGCRTVLVLTGYGRQTAAQLAASKRQPDHIAENLGRAASWVMHELGVR